VGFQQFSILVQHDSGVERHVQLVCFGLKQQPRVGPVASWCYKATEDRDDRCMELTCNHRLHEREQRHFRVFSAMDTSLLLLRWSILGTREAHLRMMVLIRFRDADDTIYLTRIFGLASWRWNRDWRGFSCNVI